MESGGHNESVTKSESRGTRPGSLHLSALLQGRNLVRPYTANSGNRYEPVGYAVRRGMIDRSRTWFNTLVHCIALSLPRYGIISPTNSSDASSRISSSRVRPLAFSRSGTRTCSAVASLSREDSVAHAFSFSILET